MADSDTQRWFYGLEQDRQQSWVERWANGQPIDDLIHTLPPGHRPSDDDPWVLITETTWETGSPSGPEYQMTRALDDFLAAEHARRMGQ